MEEPYLFGLYLLSILVFISQKAYCQYPYETPESRSKNISKLVESIQDIQSEWILANETLIYDGNFTEETMAKLESISVMLQEIDVQAEPVNETYFVNGICHEGLACTRRMNLGGLVRTTITQTNYRFFAKTGNMGDLFFAEDAITRYCTAYDIMEECLKEYCPDYWSASTYYDILTQALQVMCGVDREKFYEYQKCYYEQSKSENDAVSACQKSCHGSPFRALAKFYTGLLDFNTMMEDDDGLLDAGCRTFTCNIECLNDLYSDACGSDEAGKLFHKAFKAVEIELGQLLIKLDIKLIVPEHCADLFELNALNFGDYLIITFVFVILIIAAVMVKRTFY